MRGLWSIVLGCWLKRQGLANLESDLSQKGLFPQEHYPSESQLMPILRIQPFLCPFCLLESCGPVITQWTAATKSLQSCPTLCDPIDGSPPGSHPGILQARTLEWVAISFSNAWKWKAKVKSLSRVWLFATPWTAAYQTPPSMGFSRQEYWSGEPFSKLNELGVPYFVLDFTIFIIKCYQYFPPCRLTFNAFHEIG